ncbi:SAM-dependent methyltransferase [Saccharopolyspora gregorii]|uniref:S-adenosyl-L-methionine-dependent methyltransferase n=1 Tax=Saccharopolyspora gregorii TaxID=33914 RepID=A0ABP6RSG9_9PSEU|nr:SAM-dependent methyltransferase [Saccharopolyspora gregorii]
MTGTPEPLTGVGSTAVGVALIRARETDREDRLIADPYARASAAAAETAFRSAPDGARTWERLQGLVESFHDGRVVATRHFDEQLSAAVGAGCTQVVDVGAGLSTRALRLPLPAHVACFELDSPAMFAFKEPVLRDHPARPRSAAQRTTVPTDLRGNWAADLTAAGFDPARRTAWLEEGVLAYLPPADATAVLDTITELSAPGSRLVKTAIAAPDDETYRRMREFVGRGAAPSAGESGVDQDNAHRLGDRGWRVEFHRHHDLARRWGRAAPEADSGGYASGVRLPG